MERSITGFFESQTVANEYGISHMEIGEQLSPETSNLSHMLHIIINVSHNLM